MPPGVGMGMSGGMAIPQYNTNTSMAPPPPYGTLPSAGPSVPPAGAPAPMTAPPMSIVHSHSSSTGQAAGGSMRKFVPGKFL